MFLSICANSSGFFTKINKKTYIRHIHLPIIQPGLNPLVVLYHSLIRVCGEGLYLGVAGLEFLLQRKLLLLLLGEETSGFWGVGGWGGGGFGLVGRGGGRGCEDLFVLGL